MNTECKVIKEYLNALEKSDYRKILELFTEDGVVDSPLYGKKKAQDFYQILFETTSSSKIKIMDICFGKKYVIAYFTYEWELEDGFKYEFECADVFQLENGKIAHLKIIYDTYPVRKIDGVC